MAEQGQLGTVNGQMLNRATKGGWGIVESRDRLENLISTRHRIAEKQRETVNI